MSSLRLLIAASVGCAAVYGTEAGAADRVEFSRDVLPILSDKCFHCHGPDDAARQADLRLDTQEGLFRERDGVRVVSPGQLDRSELIQRVLSIDPEQVMPPPASIRMLTLTQKEILQRWVTQGAAWGVHWAFVSATRPTPPATHQPTWTRNEIDRFILARLEQGSLSPAPEAPRETWLRRATLDLTGLPPTLAELDAFLADTSSDAYERVVERLFRSPRYGERMAVDWLDIARFADTHGYQMDRTRPMWVYRDWVIDAYNRNLPFDQFVTWQLAGDLLPNASKEQRLATAFNRLHMQNEEGGIVEEEFRVAYVVDRVNTFGAAFLGLTLECARCHDHKYDPITQRDFYSLFAFFQNIDESGQTSYFTAAMPVPTLLLADDATGARLDELTRQIKAQERILSTTRDAPETTAAFKKWLLTRKAASALAGLVAHYPFDKLEKNQSPNGVGSTQPAKGSDGPTLVPSPRGQAVLLSGENGFTFPGVGHFTRVDPFSLSLWIKADHSAPRAVVLHHSKAPIDAGSRGYELLLEHGRVAFGLHHMWPGNSLKVVTRETIPLNAWTHLAVTYDGSSRAGGVTLTLNGERAELEIVRDGLEKDITYGGGEPDLTLGFRFRDNGFKHGQVDDLRVYQRALTQLEIRSLAERDDWAAAWSTPADALSANQRAELFEYFLSTSCPPVQAAESQLHALRKQHNDLVTPLAETMVMREMPQPKPAFLLKRGNYDQPTASVTAGTPAALLAFPENAPRNRLGLAQWLTHPDHPLMARVTVNRFWQQCFGAGLVESSDNFGATGAPPSHPELLDWLARDFIEHGWNVQRLLKQIVLSATYRQSSIATAEQRAHDPGNQWLSRAPVRRLTAEMLRDQALLVSGLLVEKVGGPSVKPYQPAGLWEEKAMGRPTYDQGKGDDLYRRSLYSFWKRTVPPPSMIAFDAADRNVCVVRRQSTNTPLQALALLNDEQHVEAARCLAQRTLHEGGDDDAARLAWMFRTAVGRGMREREAKVLSELVRDQRMLFAANRESAVRLLSVGQKPRDVQLDLIDHAAYTVAAQALMNYDEAVQRR